MTKRHTRLFFIGGTAVFALVFLGLTLDSHRQFGRLTNVDRITEDVKAGKDVWHQKNCINCHTLLGEGAYYAPDLTKITKQRGEAYLTAFLRDPSQFYSEEVHRRLMPNPNLDDTEIAQVIAFLDWVSEVDNQGGPPRPILVSGGMPGAAVGAGGAAASTPASNEPVALGQALFNEPELACVACHATQPGVTLAGPSLAGVALRAAETVAGPTYTGAAEDAEGYLREAIVAPTAHLVPGANFATGGDEGISLMPADYGERLTDDQIGHLVAYLMTFR
jgi:nitric oxide reductase subunit C